jgi:uncharacterized membrane protein
VEPWSEKKCTNCTVCHPTIRCGTRTDERHRRLKRTTAMMRDECVERDGVHFSLSKDRDHCFAAITSTTAIMTNRRLWLDEGNLMDGDNPFGANPNDETHDSVFQKFAHKPPQKGLVTIASNALVVGQEFVLTALVLARHREAFLNEANPHRIENDSDYAQRIAISIGCISLALFLVILYNNKAAPFSSSSLSKTENAAPQSRKSKVRQRFTDAILMGILLRFLAAVLRTLTASYSSDTVHALAVATFILHLLACDYSYANGFDDGNNIHDDDDNEADKTRLHPDSRPTFEGGTISLTAAFFGTTLLASRLESNGSVYAFVSSSVILFALYPASRHQVARQTQKSNRWGMLALWSCAFNSRKDNFFSCLPPCFLLPLNPCAHP